MSWMHGLRASQTFSWATSAATPAAGQYCTRPVTATHQTYSVDWQQHSVSTESTLSSSITSSAGPAKLDQSFPHHPDHTPAANVLLIDCASSKSVHCHQLTSVSTKLAANRRGTERPETLRTNANILRVTCSYAGNSFGIHLKSPRWKAYEMKNFNCIHPVLQDKPRNGREQLGF